MYTTATNKPLSNRPASDYVLTLMCPDRPGIIFELSRFLYQHDCTIVESQQFVDRDAGRFFMRIQFEPAHYIGALDVETLRDDFHSIAGPFNMKWRLLHAAERQRVLIMVSRYGHCLNDLLYRAHNGALNIDIAAVVSNHTDLAPMTVNYGIPFHHIPVSGSLKSEAEQQLRDLITELDVDLTVLARYMQILSADLCKQLDGRAINIHHSILPSFKGARPYHQAHTRGVKLMGATAHYVTEDLDEGPIIEQEITRIDHSMSANEVTTLGWDNESRALSRAVRWHTENRVLLDGQRTVVFQ